MTIVRDSIANALVHGCPLYCMDRKNAILDYVLTEELYMQSPSLFATPFVHLWAQKGFSCLVEGFCTLFRRMLLLNLS